jgi:hypothetical protein
MSAHLVRHPWKNKSQGGYTMKPAVYVVISIFFLVAGVIFLSATCDSSGGESGTLTVGLNGIPSGADGHLLLIGAFEDGVDAMIAPLLAAGSIEIGTETSTVMQDPTTSAVITLDAGDYDLYMWIDMNDNLETVQEPEQNIDMTHTSFPFDATIDGDTIITVLSSAFELFPGF